MAVDRLMKGRECVGNVCCDDDDTTTEAEAEEYDEIISIPTIAIILPSVLLIVHCRP